jgi:cell cycle checkpoint protein
MVSASQVSFTRIHTRILPDDHSFIALAPTFVTKALKSVLAQAVPQLANRPPNSALQLIAMTSNGDLRSAINSLQLLCSRQMKGGKKRKVREGEEDIGGSNKKISGKGSRGGKGAKLDVSEDLRAV